MILAAGLGTRLLPLTRELPKPLCPVGDRAPIDDVVARFLQAGLSRVAINAHHLREAWLAWAAPPGAEVVRVFEDGEEPYGTAGGVANARACACLGDAEVVVWNGDVVADVDLPALLAAHRATAAYATLTVRPTEGSGAVGLDAAGRVVRLRSASASPSTEVASVGYLGVAVLSPACVAELPERGCLVGDVWIPELLRAGRRPLASYLHEGTFRDIGSPAEYLAANLDWLEGRGSSHHVGEGAVVASEVELDHTLVGAGARVLGRGALRRVVVWPGASVVAPLEDAIVTRGSVVPVGGLAAATLKGETSPRR